MAENNQSPSKQVIPGEDTEEINSTPLEETETNTKETEQTKENEHENLVSQLEQWFIDNRKLPKRVERLLLERFIVSTNYNLIAAQAIIETNYGIRNKYPDIFLNRDPADLNSISTFQYADIVPLPCLTPDGYKVTIFRLRNSDPSLVHHLEDTRAYIMLTDARFSMPDVEESSDNCGFEKPTLPTATVLATGEVQLFDMTGFSMQHTSRLSFSVLRIYIRFLQTAFPVRIRQIHMINCPTFLNKIVAIVRPFLSREVFKMMHFHTTSIDDLYEYIPRQILPEEYGGEAGKLDDLKDHFMNSMLQKRDYLMDPDYWRIETT